MTNNYGENIDNTTATSTGSDPPYQSVSPVTVEEDEALNDAMEGEDTGNEDDGKLDLDSNSWGGMQSGAVNKDSTQDSNWMNTVPEEYRAQAAKWSNQQGVMKITPKNQRQKFTYATIAYIADKQQEPKTQIFPISDLKVQPHQISFEFYDTTEGRIGVSNAVEKHMACECDVYLTDLVYYWWNHGDDNQNDFTRLGWAKSLKQKFWNTLATRNVSKINNLVTDIEQTAEFADFRNTFLQQHLGWVCLFSSHAFGVFQGVLTEVSYDITSGETLAKWHLKFEEALFITDENGGGYSTTGQKQDSSSTSGDGSTTGSGDASSGETNADASQGGQQ